MSKRKRQAKKRLAGAGRLKDASRWLEAGGCEGKPLVAAYAKRYGVSEDVARNELTDLGMYDELCIDDYEQDGIEWEYRVVPRSREMFVVPKGTEEYEMYEIHGLI